MIDVCGRMREDWNERAREDANYYVAFGRRDQGEDEFYDTARDLARGLELELRRLPPAAGPRTRRALEIGCGPGRLMRPLSRHVGEIHGVDVSDEMVRLARERLRGIPHAHVHATGGADLALFASESFDFVYSYAVFQHIPSREVVFSYLQEARRVLRTGGILRCQINGLPESAARYDTWNGVRIPAADVAAFARENDLQLLALEGASTQYMWITCRKREPGGKQELRPSAGSVRIRRITNAHSSEPVAPNSGRFSSVSMWVEDLPADCDLNSLEVRFGGRPGTPFYLGRPEPDGLQQLNVTLPAGVPTGLCEVELLWLGSKVADSATLRIMRAGPAVPRLTSVSDGVNLLSGTRIVSGSIKVAIEEAAPWNFEATVSGAPVHGIDAFLTDPLPPRYEVNFMLPPGLSAGPHDLQIRLGRRRFAAVAIEIV
jgi:SAM-dependent methyltransferase